MDPRLNKKDLDAWEPVEPVEALGEGRQGVVYKVRNRDAYKLRSHATATMTEAVKRMNVGDGAAASVLVDELARYQRADEGRLGAVKLFKFEQGEEGKRDRKRFAQEVAILSESREPGLLKLLHANVTKEFFITELYPQTLEKALRQFAGNVAKTFAAVRPVVQAVAWLNDTKRTIHRDIKPDNMFVDERGFVVLGDFGIAIDLDSEGRRGTQLGDKRPKGTIYWMAPWAYKGDRPLPIDDIDGSFDAFSLGKVIWSMLLGRSVYSPHAFCNELEADSEYNVEHVFPNASGIGPASELLSKCVVRLRKHCTLDSAAKLLDAIEALMLEPANTDAPRSFDLVKRQITGRCAMCNRGVYVFASHGGAGVGMLANLLVWNCNACGHVVTFATESGQPFPVWTR